jgi:hypothetical protein
MSVAQSSVYPRGGGTDDQIDTMTFEFAHPKLERIVALTAADRRWMDDVVRTVEETWDLPDVERSS